MTEPHRADRALVTGMLLVAFLWMGLFIAAAARGRDVPLFSVVYNLPITLAFGALASDLMARALNLGWERFVTRHGVILLVWAVGGVLLVLRLFTKSIDVSGHVAWSLLMGIQCLVVKAPSWVTAFVWCVVLQVFLLKLFLLGEESGRWGAVAGLALGCILAIQYRRHIDERAGELDSAPGPSPWYLRDGKPTVPGFTWGDAGRSNQTAGAIILSGRDGTVLILDFHNYVLPIDPETLLVWHQRHVKTGPTAPVALRIFRLADLRPLEGDLEELCGIMRRAGEPFMASSSPICEVPVPTTVANQQLRLSFPEQLRHIEELLILCHSSAVKASPTWEINNLALLVARPSDGTYELFPQDWFNSAKLDYGYQGVTRVARDPRTGSIHGEGVRISPFVLDETLRNTL